MTNERGINKTPGLELRERGDGGAARICGYAVIWGALSHVLRDAAGFSFRERFARGAFDEWLAENPDISAQVQHQGGLSTIGRTTNGTLEIRSDEKGLYFSVAVPDTQAGRDIITLCRDGYVDKCSFGFWVLEQGESWDTSTAPATRTVTRSGLREISVVDGPAYEATSAEVRSIEAPIEKRDDPTRSKKRLQVNAHGEILPSWISWFAGDLPYSSISVSSLMEQIEGRLDEFDEIEIAINSPGGDAFESIAIFNRLREIANSGKKIITRVEGFAASGASLLFLAGDERIIHTGGHVMIHSAITFSRGNAAGHREAAVFLDRLDQSQVDIIVERTGMDTDKAKKMVSEEKWMNDREAIANGFATILSETKVEPDEEIENRVRAYAYAKAPEHLRSNEPIKPHTLSAREFREYLERRRLEIPRG